MPPPSLDGVFNFHFAHSAGVIAGEFTADGLRRFYLLPRDTPPPMLAALPAQAEAEVLLAALQRYFLGEPEDFRGIALDLNQGTTFQRSVWSAARAVPWGATATYGDLAAQLGRGPGSARAVGHALGQNPLHLLVPCHRFLAASGHLVDYAGGIEWKETLLRLEGHHLA